MKYRTLFVLVVLWLSAAARATVGEFPIPAVMPLTAEQRDRLRHVVEQDPEAAALAEATREAAMEHLDAAPRPLEVIHYEGLVNTDPRRIASVEHLRDMTRAGHLLRYWQVTGDQRAAEALRRYISAWTTTYRLTGNDVNENKLYPLLVAYHQLRDTFAPGEREEVDRFVQQFGERHLHAVQSSDHFTNRYGKHIRLLAISGLILDRAPWIAAAEDGVKRFVTESLYADGTSHDLNRRDTLTYHGSALKPPLELAILLGAHDLYDWESAQGGSLRKSVDYVVPYALGQKTREEWVNSKSGLDRRRAEAGLEKYRRGRLFDPADAKELMEIASFFDPDLVAVVRRLSDGDAQRFATWQMLMNHIARQETP